MKHTYKIYDGDELIYTGFPNEILMKFGGSLGTNLMHYVKTNGLYRRKYTVKVGEVIGAADIHIWDVTLNGKLVYTGTDRQIAEHFGLENKFRGSLYCRRNYKIQHIYKVEPHKNGREDAPKDPVYEDIIRQLKITPNTIVMQDKDRIVRKLARNGIKVRAELMSDKTGWVLWAI